MMTNHTGRSHAAFQLLAAQTEAQVDILAAIPELRIETACRLENRPAEHHAGGGDAGYFHHLRPGRAGSHVSDFALRSDHQARMVQCAVVDPQLQIADGAKPEVLLKPGEHRFQPSGQQDEIIVEENQELPGCGVSPAVAGRGKAEIVFVKNCAAGWLERLNPFASAVGTAVVHQNDLMVGAGGQGVTQARQHGLGEGQTIVEWDDERELHAGQCFMHARPGGRIKPFVGPGRSLSLTGWPTGFRAATDRQNRDSTTSRSPSCRAFPCGCGSAAQRRPAG